MSALVRSIRRLIMSGDPARNEALKQALLQLELMPGQPEDPLAMLKIQRIIFNPGRDSEARLVNALNGLNLTSGGGAAVQLPRIRNALLLSGDKAALRDAIGALLLLSEEKFLSADGGSYAFTGTAASFERGREVAADGGSFAFTGTAATLSKTATLWTPAEIGADLIGWWESDDAANFTLTGALVDQWENLAGSMHFNGTTTGRPTRETVADFGGLNAIKFDNSDDILTSSALLTQAQPLTFIGLYRTGATIDDLDFYVGDGGCQLTMRWSGVSDKPHAFCGSAVARTNTVLSTSTTYIDVTLLNGASSYTRLNGNAADPTTFNPGTTGFSVSNPTLGLQSGRSCFAGHHAFLALVKRALTQTEYEKFEGYIAHRYSRTANLPGGHPYESSPPTV